MAAQEWLTNNPSEAKAILSWWNGKIIALFAQGRFEELVRSHYTEDIHHKDLVSPHLSQIFLY